MSAAASLGIDEALLEESAGDLYEHAPCGYISALPGGTIARINATLLGWLGLTRFQVVGKRRVQELFTVPGRVYHETHVAPLLRMQGHVNEIAAELACRERPPLPVLVAATQKRDEAGEPLFDRYTIFNATERRKYERELLHQRRRAERADKAKADLLAMVGHDMRSPLAAIRLAATLLERSSPSEQQAKYVRVLLASSGTLQALAQQMLEYSLIEAGKVTIAEGPFEPRALLRETAETFGPLAEEKGLTLVEEVDEAVPPRLSGDAARIRQILANLAGNAIKFTAAGRVTLAMKAQQARPDGVTLELAVADTGIGIPPDRLDAIFEEFTQAGPEIGPQYGGTGLGLAICRRLSEAMGAKLSVESQPGKGSTFRFTLPLGLPVQER